MGLKPRTWTNSPDRTFTSREEAAAFYACLIWCREWSRRLKDGKAMTTIEEVCREAVQRAGNARIEMAELPEEGNGLDRHGMQELQDSEGIQYEGPGARRLAGNMVPCIHPVRHAQEAEREIDRLISELESGEGAGE